MDFEVVGYDDTVVYKKGKDNLVADALSRCHEETGRCNVVLVIIPQWKNELKESCNGDSLAQDLYTALMTRE